MNPRLVVEGVWRRYGDETVLTPTTLTLQPGEIMMVRGRSGSGKTTLLNLIAGLDRPDGGRIEFHPRPADRGRPSAPVRVDALTEPALTLYRRRCLGIVFQNYNLVATLTVRENVLLPLQLVPAGPAAERVALERLARLGLAERLDAFPETLSGGEQQRVAIARALAHGPELILADEPTGSLDTRSGDAVMALLLDEVRRGDTALLMVTHSDALARAGDVRLDLEAGAHAGADALAR